MAVLSWLVAGFSRILIPRCNPRMKHATAREMDGARLAPQSRWHPISQAPCRSTPAPKQENRYGGSDEDLTGHHCPRFGVKKHRHIARASASRHHYPQHALAVDASLLASGLLWLANRYSNDTVLAEVPIPSLCPPSCGIAQTRCTTLPLTQSQLGGIEYARHRTSGLVRDLDDASGADLRSPPRS